MTGSFFLQSPVDAQSITVSEEMLLKNENTYDILGKINGVILLFRDQETRFEITAYDDEMRQLYEREFQFERRKTDIISLIPGDTAFHVIYGYRHKGDYFVKHRVYNEDAQLLDSVTIVEVHKMYFSPRFKQTFSEDKSKILLFRTDKESEMNAMVYDLHSRKTLWTKQMLFKSGSLRRDFRKMLVSDNGDMMMILDNERMSDRYKEFSVIRINSATNVLAKKSISLNDFLANDLHARYDNVNHQLVMSGLYNEKVVGKSKGMYVATLKLDGARGDVRILPFTEDLLEEVHGKDVSIKKGVANFTVQDIVLRQDGGVLLIAEMNKEYSRRPTVPVRRDGGFGRSGWVDYYFEDLVIFSVHPDGREHWRTVLHKKQYSQDDEGMYSSFFLFKTPEKLRLLFNDEIKQENTVSEYMLRGNGFYKRNSVFSTDYQRLRLRFRDAVQVAHNECIVPSERNSRLSLVKIRYGD